MVSLDLGDQSVVDLPVVSEGDVEVFSVLRIELNIPGIILYVDWAQEAGCVNRVEIFYAVGIVVKSSDSILSTTDVYQPKK